MGVCTYSYGSLVGRKVGPVLHHRTWASESQKPMSNAYLSVQERTATRPDDCECLPHGDLPCWPCFEAGFEITNPESEAFQE